MRREWTPKLTARDLWGDGPRRTTVLFNAHSLAPGGSYAVLTNYLRAFHEVRPEWRLIVLRGPYRADLDTDIGDFVQNVHCGAWTASLPGRTWWEKRWMGRACRRLDADIYFGPNGVYHRSVTIPQCLLVQDPTPYVLRPTSVKEVFRAALLKRSWRRGVLNAACMGYTSNFMRDLIIREMNGRTERCRLIAYNGIDDAMRRTAQRPFRSPEEKQPFILSVSTFSTHKNFETLIRALALLRRDPRFASHRLRIMGRSIQSEGYIARLRREARLAGVADAVSMEVDQPWSAISEAYASASLFSLTSLCESFGIPALEAMAHGTPTVLGDCCAIPEVVGDAAELAPPQDPAALCRAWERVLGNRERYAALQAAGRRRCLEFSWTRTVGEWVRVIEELLAKEKAPSVSTAAGRGHGPGVEAARAPAAARVLETRRDATGPSVVTSPPPVKVLHVIYGMAEIIGGPPVALATLARAQAARGDRVFVMPARRTAGPQTLAAGAGDGLTVYEAPTDHHLLWYNRDLREALRRTARGCDIIHIHGTWRYHLLAAAAAAAEHGIPYIVRPAGNLGLAARGHKAMRKWLYFVLVERGAINRAAAIHCCSLKEERELRGTGLAPRTFVVPQPVDVTLTDVAPDEQWLERLCPNLREDDLILLYVGRVGFIKKLDVLLDAFMSLAADFPRWRLVIAGTHEQPEIAAALWRRAASAGLSDRVALPGTVRGPQKAALMRRAALFAQPSQHENFGLSVAEALFFGLPCVVSDGVAIGDDVAAAGAGVVCRSQSAAMAAALRPLMADAGRRGACAAAAASLAQRFAPASVAAQLAVEYKKCIDGAGP